MGQAYGCLLFGQVNNKNYKEAIQYGNKALNLLNAYPFPSIKIEVDSNMYVANKAIGNFGEALKYFEAYYKQNSDFLNEAQKKQLDVIQTRLDGKTKDLTITQLKLKLTKRQRNIQWLIFILTIFILGMVSSVVYVVRNHRFRKELYKKEKYLDKQLADTKRWMGSVSIKDSPFNQLPHEEATSSIDRDILSSQNILYHYYPTNKRI